MLILSADNIYVYIYKKTLKIYILENLDMVSKHKINLNFIQHQKRQIKCI